MLKHSINRRSLIGFAVTTAFLFSNSYGFAAKAPVFTGLVNGTGAGGYDVVAYQSENKAVVGISTIAVEFEAVKYLFSSEANRALFLADPGKYLPAYGGYCAYAVSQGYTAKIDPEAFSVVDGKLYLNYSKSVQSKWQQDTAGYISAADANWPKVLNE